MWSIIASIAAALLAGGALELLTHAYHWSWGWGVFLGLLVYIGVMLGLNVYFGKKLKSLVGEVQAILMAAQEEVTKQGNRLRSHPTGNATVMQEQLEKTLERGTLKAIEKLDSATPLYRWNVLAERQVNTLKMQLYYQIQDFEEADALLPKVMLLDPQVVAMKLARQHANNDPGLEKTFLTGITKFKFDKATLIYATYAWILVKRKELDKALNVLVEGKEKTDNPVIAANWQHIVNGKPQLFSNAALGEQWYALHLDKPPKPRASKGDMRGHPMMGKGKRRYF